MQTHYPELGILTPEIYLPKADTNWNKRSVVACDQYTSQPEYREAVASHIEAQPSTYHIIFPEVYLGQEDGEERIKNIQQAMKGYLEQGILENKGEGLIFLDRQTSHTSSRKGLIVALDLEQYDYNKGSQTLIRATEGTILDRLPPRVKIRQNAPLESPHIMVLIDDPEKGIIEPLAKHLDTYEKLYDFDLMIKGGHITGYHITDEAKIQGVVEGLKKLADPETFKAKYGVGDDLGVLLFAMGDGNHSFATAKAIWEEKKKTLSEKEKVSHPARFALVELNNVHDEGIVFEPIHRVLFQVNEEEFFRSAKEHFSNLGSKLKVEYFFQKADLPLLHSTPEVHRFRGVSGKQYFTVAIHNPQLNLEVGNLQRFLDEYLSIHPETHIDYIHGEEATETLGKGENNLGLLLPVMDKSAFFTTVIKD
jgi:hypothetical protein